MRRTIVRLLVPLLAVVLGGWTPFRAPDPDVEAGNQAYAAGRYDDALAAYDRAARRGVVDGDGLAFDRGTAELKKADAAKDPDEKRRLTDRALDDLKRAGRAKDARIRGAASYNRGNALLGQDKLEDAIEAYKQALRDDASLDDARLNLELALRRRQHQPPPQQGQGQGQNQQGKGPGQHQPGGGSPGKPSPQDPPGDGSNQQNGSAGEGGNPQAGSGNHGQAPKPSGGAGSNGQNPDDAGGNRPSPQAGPSDPSTPSGRGAQPKGPASRGRTAPRSPRTPAEGKLDDLDDYSRRLQKDEARRHATGRAADPQHDW
jgi:hypothetical protein